MLIPDLDAGCSLAASITAEQLREWKAEHPGAVVVSYVNTTAEVKAESDYCCTSGNAQAVIEAIPADQEILFLPGHVPRPLAREGDRPQAARSGSASATSTPASGPADIERWQAEAPGRRAARPPRVRLREPGDGVRERAHAHPLDRGDGHASPRQSPTSGSSSRPRPASSTASQKEAPGKRFEPVREDAVCRYMKMITLEKLRDSLRDGKYEVDRRAGDRRPRARLAIERMVAIGA